VCGIGFGNGVISLLPAFAGGDKNLSPLNTVSESASFLPTGSQPHGGHHTKIPVTTGVFVCGRADAMSLLLRQQRKDFFCIRSIYTLRLPFTSQPCHYAHCPE
ncbi:MAG: hypothetical protein Q8R13_04455, partial [bacterium]|nr:hypothetical protein [bacterium]